VAALADATGFADFLTVFGDALPYDGADDSRLPAADGREVDFAADFFDDFRAMRLPFVAFRRSKG
jgi:hypothetical protein